MDFKPLLDFFATIGREAVKAEERVLESVWHMHAALPPQTPALDPCLHCDIVRARHLHPTETEGAAGEVAPLVVAQLVNAEGVLLGEAVKSAAADTLEPVWDESLLVHEALGATAVRLSVFSNSRAQTPLGSVDVPLPPRPLPPGARTRATLFRRRHLPRLVQGWFPLRDELHSHVGELQVRLSFGLRQTAALQHRPPLRRRLAHMRITVHCATGLPAAFHQVVAQLEHQTGVTPVRDGGSPVFPDATFVFAVTESTSHLVLRLLEVEPPVPGTQLTHSHVRGEVIIPVAACLGRGKRTLWAEVLPPRRPAHALLEPQRRPKTPLGRLQVSVQLERDDYGMLYAYCGHDVPECAREPAPGRDAEAGHFSAPALHSSSGRLADCVLCCLFAPLRTVCFLQSWLSFSLNALLLAALLGATAPPAWEYTLLCAPLLLVLSPFLHGFVSTLIHARDPVALYKEDAAALAAEREAEAKYASELSRLQIEAHNRMLYRLKHDKHFGQQQKKLRSKFAEKLHEGMRKAKEEAAQLNLVKRLEDYMQEVHEDLLSRADVAERLIAACSWADPRLTLIFFFLVALPLGAALSALAYLAAAGLRSLDARSCARLAGLACFLPPAAPLTRAALAAVDAAFISMEVTPLLSGRLRRAPDKRLGHAELKAKCEAEALALVEQMQRDRRHALESGALQQFTLQLRDALTGKWVERLLSRAPNVPVQRHLRMCAASVLPESRKISASAR